MRDVILCCATAITLCFVITRPWLGILLLAIFAYMNPQRLCYGFAFSQPFFFVTVLCTVLAIFITRQWPRMLWTRDVFILLALAGWMNITFLCALNPVGADVEWNRTMKTIAFVLLSMGLMQDRRKLNLLLWAIALSIGFYGVKGGIFTIVGGGQSRVVGPADTFLADNNQLAVALAMCVPLMRYLQLQVEAKWIRLGLTVTMALTSLAIFGTYSRGGFISLAIVALVMWWKSRRKLLYGASVIACAVALLAVMPDKWTERMHSIQSYNQDDSTLGRFNAWQFAINLANDRPLTGGGFHSFTPELFQRYAPDPDNFHVAHSIYFEILGDQGYPGLFLFVAFWVSAWFTASRVRKQARRDPNLQWAADMTAMLQTALAAYLVGGAFLSLGYFDLPYQLALLVVSCNVAVKRQFVEESAETDLPVAEGEHILVPATVRT